jgi:hypothetical protein
MEVQGSKSENGNWKWALEIDRVRATRAYRIPILTPDLCRFPFLPLTRVGGRRYTVTNWKACWL